ncbi:hypothetical protein BHE74_00036471 [Ensete ventricosum]|nr:hypothetical protein BHE74_00036471 [Ensete ventricosum]
MVDHSGEGKDGKMRRWVAGSRNRLLLQYIRQKNGAMVGQDSPSAAFEWPSAPFSDAEASLFSIYSAGECFTMLSPAMA